MGTQPPLTIFRVSDHRYYRHHFDLYIYGYHKPYIVETMAEEEQISAYEMLEIEPEASEADIRRAYRQRSLKLHPDKVSPSITLSASKGILNIVL